MALPKYLSASDDIALAGLYVLTGFIIWKAYTGWRDTGNAVGSWLGDMVAPLVVPEVVNAQIKLKSAYFLPNGDLTSEALQVISTGYPNFYRVAFEGRRIKPDYSWLVDSGQPVIDADYI
ncbi:hypothetical protein [Neptunicella sp. SCSIO 80796]|uniref:hypothetical protein n=1 Tax=Neptunicella plasticusilytica TaxID=3117012 RepID=UPI003A4E66C8